jgi:hypothetical protein
MNNKNTRTLLPTEIEHKTKRCASINCFRKRCRQMLDAARQNKFIRLVI